MHNTIENRVRLLEIEGVRIDESLSHQKARVTMGPHTGTEFISVSLCGRRVRLGVCPSSGYHAVLYRDIVVVYHGNRVFVQGKLEQATAHCPRRPHIAISEPCSLNCRACPVPKMRGKAWEDPGVVQLARGSLENL
jgi:hypothetical protein